MKQYRDCVPLYAYTFVLYSYQWEIFRAAMERNILAFLETGCGKTLIAVQLMKQIAQKCKAQGMKSLMIFFAPTVNLVKQVSCNIWTNASLHLNKQM